jgi:nucleoside-diphosphate-sugar epimerase
VQEWCKQYNVVCTILRLPLVIGANPPGNLGAMIKGIKDGYYFNIAGGKAKKSMVLAEDVGKFIIKAADVGGIYNLTDCYHPTFSELSVVIARKFGKRKVYNLPLWLSTIVAYFGNILWEKFPLNSNKLNKICATLTFDDTKAREAFGWNPIRVINAFNLKNK